MKRILALAALLSLLSVPVVFASDTPPPYAELTDAPTISIDWSKGKTQSVTLGGNRTLAFANAQKGGHYTVILKQDATGSRTVTWPQSVHWPGGTPPILTTTANRKDYITFFYDGVSFDVVGFAQNL